jgi:hypothetical protein
MRLDQRDPGGRYRQDPCDLTHKVVEDRGDREVGGQRERELAQHRDKSAVIRVIGIVHDERLLSALLPGTTTCGLVRARRLHHAPHTGVQ